MSNRHLQRSFVAWMFLACGASAAAAAATAAWIAVVAGWLEHSGLTSDGLHAAQNLVTVLLVLAFAVAVGVTWRLSRAIEEDVDWTAGRARGHSPDRPQVLYRLASASCTALFVATSGLAYGTVAFVPFALLAVSSGLVSALLFC